jgi:RHS repeat-associated protein
LNTSGAIFETYHYIEGIIYKNGAFFQIGIPEGRVIFSNGNWQYEFDYKDHLGNTRASFKAENGTLVQTAKTDFDPFGVVLKGSQVNSVTNFLEYQDKLSEKVFGLNRINLGARNYNPTIGRMDNIDGMAGKFASYSLYNYALNNPLNVIDPDGNESRDIWGNTTFNGFVGDDGSGNYVGTTSGDGDDKDKGKKQDGTKTKENSNKKFIIPHNDGIEPDYTLEAILIPILKPIEWLMSSIKMSLFAGKVAAKSGFQLEKSVAKVMGNTYKAAGDVTVPIKNTELLTKLNSSSKGDWVKVYEAGLQNGSKIETHYFRNNTTGQVFDVKTKYDYWHQKAFKNLK